jgi:hypothetical protein
MTPIVQETDVSVEQNRKESRRRKNEAARQLLRQWLEDASGYDEQTWPEVKRVMEENRLSVRSRFCD